MLQESVIGLLLYLIYTADAPTRDDTIIATFADDNAILSSDADPGRASVLQYHINLLQNWLEEMGNQGEADQIYSNNIHNKRTLCPHGNISNVPILIKTEMTYLGLHLDQKLTWKNYIFVGWIPCE
jgi:hypothetical protein